jgi:hypothetical protein
VSVGIDLVSGFIECLMLVLAVDAARRGRPVYWAAVVGMGLVLYARMASGFLVGEMSLTSLRITPPAFLTIVGLAIAALTVLFDLLFETVTESEEAPKPSV